MSYVVPGTPPVVEAVSRKLSGIESVPTSELPRMAHRAAVAAQEASDAENKRLREALQLLYDNQNGPPLPSYEEQWSAAMDEAKHLLMSKGGV